MIPLSAVWAGPERDEHFAPPLLFGKTEGSTPFRFSLHVGDVGHTLIVGPTGAGKSVLLALMACSSAATGAGLRLRLRRLDPRRRARHARRLARSRRRPDRRRRHVSLQPLARIDDAAERAWAADWIVAILARKRRHHPEVKEHIWTALTSLASAPVEERTITGLRPASVQRPEAGAAPYCIGGAWGRLLDAEAEHLGTATVQAFETEG
jgi:type IV secretion system protein VirB4